MKRLIQLLLVIGIICWSCEHKLTNRTSNSEVQNLNQLTTELGDQHSPKFSNDGRYIAYISTEYGKEDIVIYDFQEKKKVAVTDSVNKYDDIEWSPDSRFLSFTSYLNGVPSVRLFKLFDKKIVTISDEKQKASGAKWSPDGNTLVMDFDDDGHLWLFNLVSKEFKQLTDMEGNETNFGFSPNGTYIGFYSRGSDFPHLQAINLKTGEITPLVSDESGFEWHPRWSRTKFEVYFYSTWNGEMTDVWITDGSETGLVRVTDREIEEFGPAMNYNDSLIAYFSWDKSNEIKIYDRESKSEKSLFLKDEIIVEWNPLNWSPNDNRLAFVGKKEKDRLYSVSLKDTSIQMVMPDRSNNYEMDAQIDAKGEYILFNDQHNIVVRNIQTGEDIIIPPQEEHYLDINPTWVPNSNGQIAFIQISGGASDTNNIWIMEKDGSNRRAITTIGGIKNYCWIDEDNLVFAYDVNTSYKLYDIWTHEISSSLTKPLVGDDNATLFPSSVSSNGKTVFFFGDFEGIQKLYKISASGGEYQEITNSTGGGEWPIISPDGRNIVFSSNLNDENSYDLYVIPVEGKEARRLTKTPEKEYGITWSADSKKVIFSANKGNLDIYTVDVNQRLSEFHFSKNQ
nr:hypothetical protein [uncultured Allomuricauda sp.]